MRRVNNQMKVVCIGNLLKYLEGCEVPVDSYIVYKEAYFFREDGSFIIHGYCNAWKTLLLKGRENNA